MEVTIKINGQDEKIQLCDVCTASPRWASSTNMTIRKGAYSCLVCPKTLCSSHLNQYAFNSNLDFHINLCGEDYSRVTTVLYSHQKTGLTPGKTSLDAEIRELLKKQFEEFRTEVTNPVKHELIKLLGKEQ